VHTWTLCEESPADCCVLLSHRPLPSRRGSRRRSFSGPCRQAQHRLDLRLSPMRLKEVGRCPHLRCDVSREQSGGCNILTSHSHDSRAELDGRSARLAASLLLEGQVLYIVVTLFHTGGDANNHAAIFADYADSGDWKGVHVAQFAAMALIVGGLIALCSCLDVRSEGAMWTARLGAVAAAVALALYAVLQAVDGVGNKQVDDAWVAASRGQKGARFASAEAMRWLEWGVRSYHDYALGLALLLVAGAAVAARAALLPSPAAYLIALTGVGYLIQGWVVGSEGFSATHTTLILVAWVLSLAWMTWLAVLAWRPHLAAMPRRAG
jgi:hypothetical protein